ncbi:hypothetical protein P7L78_21195 [Tistrella bauzanensis]|uniref:hypothetical protein n=1 Tax=Tistrella TaxID=171436 RepID=UPI0031F67A8D
MRETMNAIVYTIKLTSGLAKSLSQPDTSSHESSETAAGKECRGIIASAQILLNAFFTALLTRRIVRSIWVSSRL